MTIEIQFKPNDGRIPGSVLQRLVEAVAKAGGKALVLTLKEQKKRRSLNQNAYYWGVMVRDITKAFREAGNDMDEQEIHEYLKKEVGKLSRIAVLPDGEVVTIPGSTKRLTTSEFCDYVAKVTAWAAGMQIMIEPPSLLTS